MDFRHIQQVGFAKSKGNFANFDLGDIYSPEIAQAYMQDLHSGGWHMPKKHKGPAPDPTHLMLAPDAGGGGSNTAGVTSTGQVLQESRDYNFVVDNSILPNGYPVGTGPDRNIYKLNSGKAALTINGAITGQWSKWNPTLVRLGYAPANISDVVKISSPTNLAGYEIPLKFLKKI